MQTINPDAVILIVDDTPVNIDTLAGVLKPAYNVKVAINGETALKIAMSAPVPDLILLDIMMPDMDGYEVLKRLKDSDTTRDIPVILISAMGETEDKVKAFSLGGIDYITKPFQVGEVLARVDTHLSLKQLQKDLRDKNRQLEERTRELSDTLENLKITQQELIKSEKMAALGQLVAGVAHEINTPVGLGVSESSFLHRKTQELSERFSSGQLKKSELEKYVKQALDSTESILLNLNRAAQLIMSFKQVAVDQTSEHPREFNLKQYITEVLISLKPRYRGTPHSISVICPESIVINSYPGAWARIITNLVENSFIHGFEGIEEGKIAIEITEQNDTILFCYSDTGHGMTQEQLEKMYDPFFTTKRSQGGTGLGMHIVYNLVYQVLHGHIECRSELGSGVNFRIQIPRKA